MSERGTSFSEGSHFTRASASGKSSIKMNMSVRACVLILTFEEPVRAKAN